MKLLKSSHLIQQIQISLLASFIYKLFLYIFWHTDLLMIFTQVIKDATAHGAAVLGVPVKATIKEVGTFLPISF
jgi:hypothetical protein